MKVYEKILEILRLHEVENIYGVPGDAINPLTDALHTQTDITFRHMAHEEAGAFAASAAAKLTGRLQVCSGTVGPGAIHLLNGLYDAQRDRAPIILTLRAKDLVPYESPHVAGGLGLLGSRGGVTAMQDCDLLMGDFLSAVRYELPIKVVVFNNRKLGLIKAEQESEGYPERKTELHNPDYAKLAEAMGARGFAAKKPSSLRETLNEAFACNGPAIIDAWVNPDELTRPPKIEAEQALGFGLAKVKELLATVVGKT